MRILDLYIARIIVYYTLIVFAVLLGLFTFVTFLDELGELGRGNYGVWEAIQYVVLTIPKTVYDVFPMAALLGSMLGLSSMANDSELIVMRAAGVSLVRIVGAVLKVGAVLAAVAIVIGEVVTPITSTLAQRGRAEALQQNIKQHTNFGLWMRDHHTYVNVGEVLPDLSLLKVRVFEFDDEGRLRSLVSAKNGQYVNERWRLGEIKQTLINREGAESKQVTAAYWRTEVSPQILSVFLIRPDQLSIWQLNQYIRHLRENNQDTSSYELSFWNKVVTPLATAVMVILAIPFVFGQIRSGGLGRGLFIGIMLGLLFFVADKGFGYVVLVYNIAPMIGALLPTLAFLGAGVFMLRRIH
ncbi:MAG: LPS export ABC transporter permease LptG [Gammaproteobacteria bacterium]|nr:LPS export ABC transporter permease LptG [Gammaproteobacteria bacterium]